MNVLKRLLSFSRKHFSIFLVAIIVSVFASILDVTFLYFIKQCADNYHLSPQFTPFVIIFILLSMATLRSVFNYLGEIKLFDFGRKIVIDVRRLLYQKILSVKMSDIHKHQLGDLTTKLLYQSELLGSGILTISKSVLQEGLITISILGALLYMNFYLTMLVLVTFVVIFYLMQFVAKYMRSHSYAVQDKLSELTHFMDQTKSAIKTIFMHDMHKEMNLRFYDIIQRHNQHQLKINRASALSSGIIHFLITLPLACLIWVVMVFPEWTTAGDFAALIFGFSRIYAPMKRLSTLNGSIQNTIAAGDSMFEWFDMDDERRDGDPLEITTPPDIKVKNVSVMIDGKQILSECDFNVPPKSIIAFAGETGSGKTTLLQLIAGLIEPSQGSFLINDQPIEDLYLPSWRKQIGYVDQSLPLFNLSIAENVAFFADIDMSRVAWACHIAAIDKDINAMADGYDQIIDYGGTNLSGGQRQRIVLARAIYHATHLLIIDEATSAVDNETEQLIYERLAELDHLTILLSSHREAGLRFAKQIVVIDDGKVIETGSFDSLTKKDSRFKQLIGLEHEIKA
ncbi:MAG: ABC transporter ATP-binding protein [Pseudomonadota bacterium]|nr:ABC transporter ATP-binding protein [Pseudomonadota bacterium]